MKVISLFIIVFFPAFVSAQFKHPLAEQVQPADRLLKVGDHTVLIRSMDSKNEAHKWTNFDSALAIISEKKLVTPYGSDIINQTYLESVNSIIRVDQYRIDEQLYISAYVFDVKGNILYRKDIMDTVSGRKMPPSSYTISQSADKQVVSLVQAMVVGGDNINVSTITFNNELKISGNNNYNLPFDPELLDMYMPMVHNTGQVLVFIVDKFDSYKLGSVLNCYLMDAGAKAPKRIQFDFERKKVKGLNFNISGDTLYFSALFSEQTSRKDIAGVLHAGLEISKLKKIPLKEHLYGNDEKKRLRQVYGKENLKGNILNYLFLLPAPGINDSESSYAGLLSPEGNLPTQASSTVPPPIPGLGEIKQRQAYENALVGTRPQGSSQPLSVAEASVYAGLSRSIPAPFVNTDNYYNSPIKERYKRSRADQNNKNQYRNLLFFSFKTSSPLAHQYLRLKSAVDPEYAFWTYIPGRADYSVLHYVASGLDKAYLKKTTINQEGMVTEKKIFEDDNDIILPGYNFLVSDESLTTFYEDKVTGETGLLKISL